MNFILNWHSNSLLSGIPAISYKELSAVLIEKMNDNDKNISMDQQLPITQESASQGEDISPFNDAPITSSLQAGINYCRSMAEQMTDEIKSLQEKYDSTRQTNRVLKQNLVDLENEKQKLIADFQEDFRKFNSLNSWLVHFNFMWWVKWF